MRNKNNPQSLVHSNLPSFPRSTFDRGNKVKYSLGIGGYTPVERYDISANSHVKMRLNTKLDSFPSISPLYGTLNLRFDVFFCPYRLYIPELFNNNITEIDEIDNIKFPMLDYIDREGYGDSNTIYSRFKRDGGPIELVRGTEYATVVPYGSALTYLGYPQMALLRGKFGDDAGVNQDPSTDWTISSFVSPVFNMTESQTYWNYIYESGSLSDYFVPEPYKTGSTTPWTFNLIPWLAYIDTYCHYIANPFDEYIPIRNMFYDNADNEFYENEYYNSYEFIELKNLQKIVPMFRETAGSQTMTDASSYYKVRDGVKYMNVHDSLFDGKWWPFGMSVTDSDFISQNDTMWNPNIDDYFAQNFLVRESNKFFNTGILPATYKPDYFTTWIDSDDYQRAAVSIPSMPQGITVDLLRRRQREWAFNIRQLMSSKRYTDYNYMQYGADLNLKDYPIYVGGDTIRFAFQDILSQSNNGNATNGDTLTNRVGGTAGKAYFDTRFFGEKMKEINFTARENGLLLICARLVPDVDYGRGVDKFLLKSYMSDLFKPIYDAVGFQDIQAMELDAGVSDVTSSIGKVPAYYEYMSSYDKVKGLFQTDGFRSWTFQRLFTRYGELTENTEVGFEYLKPMALPTTYIMPEQFGYNFAYNGDAGHNFGLVTDINLKVYQPQSKQLLNTRW